MTDSRSVIVVGAGLAGMSAAVCLSEAGYRVQVLEANTYIGGRTSSWIEDGLPIESGLHRFLGFYTALPALLEKVGIKLDDILCWEDEIEIRVPDEISAVLGLAPLHKPLETLGTAFGNNDFLPPADKLGLGKMFAAAAKEYVTDPDSLDATSVLAYAQKHKVSRQAIRRLLIPITEGIFFLPINQYSMYNLMGLFMPYLTSMPKLRVGAFTGGMSEVMMQPLARYVQAHGGTVRTAMPVERLLVQDGTVRGVMASGEKLSANSVILATSLRAAQRILQQDFAERAAFHPLFKLPTMPAVTFQIELNEPSMAVDRTTFGPTTCLASFAEQSRTTFRQSKGRLSAILSPPEEFIDMPADKILPRVVKDAERLGLHISSSIIAYRKVCLPHDFYSLATGSEALRPPQQTDVPGLVLAGDYTKQPYLATMEGAVVSGKQAAALVMD